MNSQCGAALLSVVTGGWQRGELLLADSEMRQEQSQDYSPPVSTEACSQLSSPDTGAGGETQRTDPTDSPV